MGVLFSLHDTLLIQPNCNALFQMELTENACLLPLTLILKGLPYTLQET
jgi:hypothetical protein